MNYLKTLIALVAALGLNISSADAEELYEGLVETRILDFDPQSGVKSQHFFFVDFKSETVSTSYETGSTDFFGVNLDSVRDNFVASSISFSEDAVTFVLSGSTASGVGIIPNIDYKFDIIISRSGQIRISGCHDGYPAYLVQFNGSDIHSYDHKPKKIYKLFGNCDVAVSISK
ncbi:DUF3238 domain-containing protein [Primorskyibacter flagellatus]|uniref:DUF3238 domain-containing protein n=1 Tax=Primorskyibacter flagellatus TaxID=1387277 RepID=UPI003A8ED6F0